MARVFVAFDDALQRRVAVKVLPEHMAAAVSVDRFRREILLSAGLQHPHIVGVLSAGIADGLPYFVMPYVDGESLGTRLLTHGRLTVPQTVSIMKDVARALAYAHERGVVHRDIKPHNILLAGGAATVTDFGVAKALSSAQRSGEGRSTTLTDAGTSLGTPLYMAPEQAAADPDVDHRADIYAFGVTAYEMLVGEPPFAGLGARALMTARMTQDPPHVCSVRPDVPRVLADLVMQLPRARSRRPAADGARAARGARRPRDGERRVRHAATDAGGAGGVRAIGGRSPRSSSRSAPSASVPLATFRDATRSPPLRRALAAAAGSGRLARRRAPAREHRRRFGERVSRRRHHERAGLRALPRARRAGRLADACRRAARRGPLAERCRPRAGRDAPARGHRPARGEAAARHGPPRRRARRHDDLVGHVRARRHRPALRAGRAHARHHRRRARGDRRAHATRRYGARRRRRRRRAARRTTSTCAGDSSSTGAARRRSSRRSRTSSRPSRRIAISHRRTADSRPRRAASALHSTANVGACRSPTGCATPIAPSRSTATSPKRGRRAAYFISRSWRWADAERDFRRAIADRSDQRPAHQWLGELLARARPRPEAVAALQRASQLDARSPVVARSLGDALALAGRTVDALATAERAVSYDSSQVITRIMLGATRLYARQARTRPSRRSRPQCRWIRRPRGRSGSSDTRTPCSGDIDGAHRTVARVEALPAGPGKEVARRADRARARRHRRRR